jgi:serine/threonine protein kinase
VQQIVSETSFIVHHEDFRQDFMIRQISATEDITKWIDMNAHSNIVTAFE